MSVLETIAGQPRADSSLKGQRLGSAVGRWGGLWLLWERGQSAGGDRCFGLWIRAVYRECSAEREADSPQGASPAGILSPACKSYLSQVWPLGPRVMLPVSLCEWRLRCDRGLCFLSRETPRQAAEEGNLPCWGSACAPPLWPPLSPVSSLSVAPFLGLLVPAAEPCAVLGKPFVHKNLGPQGTC